MRLRCFRNITPSVFTFYNQAITCLPIHLHLSLLRDVVFIFAIRSLEPQGELHTPRITFIFTVPSRNSKAVQQTLQLLTQTQARAQRGTACGETNTARLFS